MASLLAASCVSIRFVEDVYAEEDANWFASKVQVRVDDMEGYRAASSARISRSPPIVPHIRAVERAGNVVVYIDVTTITGDWVYPQRLYFGAPPRSTDLQYVDGDVMCSSSGRCTHTERSFAALGQNDVRALVSPEQPEQIRLRVVGQTGRRVDGYVRKAEVVETLRALGALERYS